VFNTTIWGLGASFGGISGLSATFVAQMGEKQRKSVVKNAKNYDCDGVVVILTVITEMTTS